MAQARLLSMTAVLTALIWASADRLVNESVVMQATFTPIPADAKSTMLLTTRDGRDRLEVTLSGPRRLIDAVRTRGPLPVRIPVPESKTGPSSLRVDDEVLRRELIERSIDFDRLRVVSIEPREIELQVDHIVERPVDVTARVLALGYETEPQVRLNTVRVKLRESSAESLPDDERFTYEIGPEIERQLKERPFGRPQTLNVTLDPQVFGPNAQFLPPSVEVLATVRSERVTQQIPAVPVLVATSVANLSKSLQAVARDGSPLTLLNQAITVTGTPDAIARLAQGGTRVYGIIQLKQEDLENVGQVKLVTPEYHLPDGVELASPPQPIELRLEPAGQPPADDRP